MAEVAGSGSEFRGFARRELRPVSPLNRLSALDHPVMRFAAVDDLQTNLSSGGLAAEKLGFVNLRVARRRHGPSPNREFWVAVEVVEER
jgi:hypothetical protein